MLNLVLMTLILFTSPLEREVDRTVDEFLSRLDLDSTRYVVVVANRELQGLQCFTGLKPARTRRYFSLTESFFFSYRSRRDGY